MTPALGIYAEGMSGSILALNAMMREPELFDAVSVHNPITDLCNFIFAQNQADSIIGSRIRAEYGDINDENIYKVLKHMSPYEIPILKNFNYQTDLMMTYDTQKEVHAIHARKFIAKMRKINQEGDFMFINGFGPEMSDDVIKRLYNYSFLAQSLLFRVKKHHVCKF